VKSVPPVVTQAAVVQRVPVVGKVISVAAVVLKISEFAPIVWNASANWTVLPALKVRVPEPVEITLPLIVAVDNREVEILLAVRPKVEIPPKAVTWPLVPDTWNLAEAVEEPPIARSLVIARGASTPPFVCQKLMVPPALLHEGTPPVTVRICPGPPIPSLDNTLVFEAYSISPVV
jgi:hypothetical protein